MITALGRRKRVVPLRPLSFVDSAIQFEFCHHPHSLSPSVKPNLNSIVVQIDIPPKRRTRGRGRPNLEIHHREKWWNFESVEEASRAEQNKAMCTYFLG